jgi:hypothetical protein
MMEIHHFFMGKSTFSTGPWLQWLFVCLPGRVPPKNGESTVLPMSDWRVNDQLTPQAALF